MAISILPYCQAQISTDLSTNIFPFEQWDISALSLVPLPLNQALTGGSGVSHLLADMRCNDPALYRHSLHVWTLTRYLLVSLPYSEEEREIVALAALVHDIGKLTLPRLLLDKPTGLTQYEYLTIQQHCAAGARLLQQRQVDARVITLVYHHHERWDGQGYPQGLSGSAIPRGARLIAIADAFAVMTASRPYQAARSRQEALRELQRCAGTQFDPQLVHHAWITLDGAECACP